MGQGTLASPLIDTDTLRRMTRKRQPIRKPIPADKLRAPRPKVAPWATDDRLVFSIDRDTNIRIMNREIQARLDVLTHHAPPEVGDTVLLVTDPELRLRLMFAVAFDRYDKAVLGEVWAADADQSYAVAMLGIWFRAAADPQAIYGWHTIQAHYQHLPTADEAIVAYCKHGRESGVVKATAEGTPDLSVPTWDDIEHDMRRW